MCGTYNNNDNNKLLNEMQETILILHNAVETFVSSFFHKHNFDKNPYRNVEVREYN